MLTGKNLLDILDREEKATDTRNAAQFKLVPRDTDEGINPDSGVRLNEQVHGFVFFSQTRATSGRRYEAPPFIRQSLKSLLSGKKKLHVRLARPLPYLRCVRIKNKISYSTNKKGTGLSVIGTDS